MKSSNFYSKNRILGTYSSLKRELKFYTVDMLEFLPVKYEVAKTKLVIRKESWLKYVMWQKEKECRQRFFVVVELSLIFLCLFLNDSLTVF